MTTLQLLTGLLLGILIGLAAWRLRALTAGGAVAAAITGALIFGLGGLPWAVILLTFFISSSLLSRLLKKRKHAMAAEKYAKGDRRDWAQVAANGGLAVLLVIAYAFQVPWVWQAFIGAMAAVNADTWATEIGVLNRAAPRLITTGKKVEPGTSGGISPLGLAASLGGAALITGVGVFLGGGLIFGKWALPLMAGILGGVAGSLFDSFLGATVQAIYFCPADQRETEQHPLHRCGTPTTPLRGWRWLNNDLVNFAASVVGAMTTVLIWLIF